MGDAYLVVDLEATCDRTGWSHDDSEIIEIGAVLARPSPDGSVDVFDQFQTFVRPIERPELTAFCMELTHITQADVDAAPTFPVAVRRMLRWLGGRPARFGSWGVYDKNQFRRDARRHGIGPPLPGDHLDLKRSFAAHQRTRPMGMAGALERVGLPLVGTHHRGLDDARNIARLLPWALGWIGPEP